MKICPILRKSLNYLNFKRLLYKRELHESYQNNENNIW